MAGPGEADPIVVRPVDGTGEVVIDSCLPEFLQPATDGQWEPVDGASGECRSVGRYSIRRRASTSRSAR